MPRNRRPQDRLEKRSEIVDAAGQLFVESGYDATSMAQIATTAGVTPTTIYWYFDDKDALLVAVLDALMATAMADYLEVADQPVTAQVLWAIQRLEQFHNLVTVVHSRTAASPQIDTWHTAFHGLVETILADGLRKAGVPESQIAAKTMLGVFLVEGLLMHPHDTAAKAALIECWDTTGGPT